MSGTIAAGSFQKVVLCVLPGVGFSAVYGNTDSAPYLNKALLSGGVALINYYAVAPASLPNNLALYAGDTFGLVNNTDRVVSDPSLYSALRVARRTFIGYVDPGTPRYRAPWRSCPEGSAPERRFSSAWPSANFFGLPDLSFVAPNPVNTRNVSTLGEQDSWLATNLDAYARWARANGSLLLLTWDSDATPSDGGDNQILTIAYGAGITQGTNATALNHYSTTRALCDLLAATRPRRAATAPPYPAAMFRSTVSSRALTPVLPRAAGKSFSIPRAASAPYYVFEDGHPAGTTSDVALLLYYNQIIYNETHAGAWAQWNGSSWTSISGDPRTTTPSPTPVPSPGGGGSASGTAVSAGSTGTITDAQGNLWNLDTVPPTVFVPTPAPSPAPVPSPVPSPAPTPSPSPAPVPSPVPSPTPIPSGGTTPTPSYPGYNLLFADEFDSIRLYDSGQAPGGIWVPGGQGVGGSSGEGFGDSWIVNPFNSATPITNIYTAANSILSIRLDATPSQYSGACGGKPWVTGICNTSPTFNFQYGYIEWRAALPNFPGLGGSMWMLPSNGSWPPEIDINEWGGVNDGPSIWNPVAIVNGNEWPYNGTYDGTDTGFHTFALDWQAGTTTFYIDNQAMKSGSTDPSLQQSMYLIIQQNTGDSSGGYQNGPVTNPGGLPVFGQYDYVRVWDQKPY